MNVPLDEVIFFDAITTTPATSAAVDADSAPTFAVFEESTDTDIGVGGSMTKRTSLTGNYRGSFTLSAANGFEVGKWYTVIGTGIVGGVTGKAVLKNFRVVAAEAIAGKPKADVDALLGTAWLTPGTAGTPDVNAKLVGGTAQTGRDIGASVLLSSGTGTGQLDFTSGVVKSNWVQILGTAITGTAAQLAAAITKFFNVATPTGTVNSLPDAVPGNSAGLPRVSDVPTTAQMEAAILNEGDATALLAAIAAKVEEFLINEGDATATIAAIATAVNSAVVAGTVGTNAAAIKAKTDSLTFTLAGYVDSNLLKLNGADVTGSGTPNVNVASIDTDAITAASVKADAVTKIQAGLSTQTSVDDLPTNAELATALGTADDAVLAAIAALNDLSSADITAALGTGSWATDLASAANLATASAAAVLAKQILGNKHTVVEAPTGTFTITVRNDDDTATVRTIVYIPATGARTVS